MLRVCRALVPVFCLVGLAAGAPPVTYAASPPTVPVKVAMLFNGPNSIRPVAEITIGSGSVVDTFSDGAGTTIKVAGPRGSLVQMTPAIAPTRDQPGGASITLSMPTSSMLSNPGSYADTQATTEAKLVALGETPSQAKSDAVKTLVGATRTITPGLVSAAASGPSTLYPYTTTGLDATSGHIHYSMRGSYYWVGEPSHNDWWLTDSYWASAHSDDMSVIPQRLTTLDTWITWNGSNSVNDYRPITPYPQGTCTTYTAQLGARYASISKDATVCPNSIGPSHQGSQSSGAIWSGKENWTDVEAAVGVQSVHNPPGSSQYGLYESLSYSTCDWFC